MHNESFVDLQTDMSNAKMLNTNAKCWEEEIDDKKIA